MKKKKKLGQHFLNDAAVAEDIAKSLTAAGSKDTVLEIGGGGGMLTDFLYPIHGSRLWVVELDSRFAQQLQNKFPLIDHQILNKSFLNLDDEDIDPGKKLYIIGNFPYQISTEIVFKVLEMKDRVPQLVGMFQKEVAHRFASGPGSRRYGVTSIFVQLHYDVEILMDLEPHYFEPPPKVHSSVIRMERKVGKFNNYDEKKLKKLVKMAFNQRRKTIRNALKSAIKDPETLQDPYFDQRAEQLSIEEFIGLSNRLEF